MALLQTAALVRRAHAQLQTAQELRARWDALDPQAQEAARAERDRTVVAAQAVRDRLTYGVRGFGREFNAARKGEDSTLEEPESLPKVVKELGSAVLALRAALDAPASSDA